VIPVPWWALVGLSAACVLGGWYGQKAARTLKLAAYTKCILCRGEGCYRGVAPGHDDALREVRGQ
jgi:hypothetical protein